MTVAYFCKLPAQPTPPDNASREQGSKNMAVLPILRTHFGSTCPYRYPVDCLDRYFYFTIPYSSMHNACSLPVTSRGTRPLADALHRNSTFIGIRNYFRSLSSQAKPTVYDSRPPSRRAQSFSSSATSHATAAAHCKPSQYELPTDVYFSENSPLAPSTRFDWRLRATSRHNHRNDSLGKRDGARAYMKRVVPSCTEVQPGESLYEEIQNYRER